MTTILRHKVDDVLEPFVKVRKKGFTILITEDLIKTVWRCRYHEARMGDYRLKVGCDYKRDIPALYVSLYESRSNAGLKAHIGDIIGSTNYGLLVFANKSKIPFELGG